MVTSEDEVAELAQRLRAANDVEEVLKRVKDTVAWTPALAESAAGRALFSAMKMAPASTAQKEARVAYYDQLREAELKETMERWWSCPPLVSDGDDVLELTFVDLTPGDERWEPERIRCTEGEPFAHAAQRFRVQANKKYRHPWLPSMHYTLVLDHTEAESGRVAFDSLAARPVADVLSNQNGNKTVEYVRDDNSRAHREERDKSPARLLAPWDRARILPSWCRTPDSWIKPVPPPGFGASKTQGAQFYLEVPTIHVPGIGIVPSATKPRYIARSLYWPVLQSGETIDDFPLDRERDYVPPSERLVPGALTAENARALLGRYVQSSTEPLRDDGPPSNKKRKTAVNKYASQTVAIAWGLSLDGDGRPDWLHCVIPLLNVVHDCAFDLKGLRRRLGIPNVVYKQCEWIGAVVLPGDQHALELAVAQKNQPQEPAPDAGDTSDNWTNNVDRWIRLLNTADIDKLVEVGEDGTFVAGDIELSKADTDDWETYISGAKPGLWRMSVAESGTVHFAWVREGSLDYDALPRFSGGIGADEGEPWDEVGSFSVDSGFVGLFSKSALEALIGEGDKQDTLETLVDAMNLDELGEYMPGGVVVSGDDGGHIVEGIKDATGKIVKLRMQGG